MIRFLWASGPLAGGLPSDQPGFAPARQARIRRRRGRSAYRRSPHSSKYAVGTTEPACRSQFCHFRAGATIIRAVCVADDSCDLPPDLGRAARLRAGPTVNPDLATRWGCRATTVHLHRRWWSLTPPFHPPPAHDRSRGTQGGLLSVALSRGSPRVGVTHHLALWCPDFHRVARTAPPG